MKKFLLTVALLSCFAFAARGDDGQDITVQPVALGDYMAVSQGAVWTAPDGNVWSLWLGSDDTPVQDFPFTLSGTALSLAAAVNPFDISGCAAVEDIVDLDITGMYGGNWLAAGIYNLRLQIAREGYSPAVLAAAESLRSERLKESLK